MLTRILEPEVMDTLEEATDYDDMDHSHVNRLFVDDLIAAGIQGDILDLGTGTAQIPIELCQRVEECRVMAVDLSISMLEIARYNVEMAGLSLRVNLDHADGKELMYPEGHFDGVISNSIVHHVPQPETVMREALRLTRSGGLVFFRDLIRPADVAELDHLTATYAGDENDAQQKMFRDSLHASLTVAEVQEIVKSLGADAQDVSATSDRHWTWSTRV